ncbi:MAG: substrate-binding domain-containing protein [Cyanobacteria bacterium P01_A01_bin.40]
MLKKHDILPLILAAISTALIVGLGYLWLTKTNAARIDAETEVANNSVSNDSIIQADLNAQLSAESLRDSTEFFVIPAIVPEGTAVDINGSSNLAQINQALGRSFHRQFPGTAITTDADGNTQGINLLTSGNIDIAALDRPLNNTEKAAGLGSIKINKSSPDSGDAAALEFYYAYQKPANAEVEAFLGFVLSPQGQESINQY